MPHGSLISGEEYGHYPIFLVGNTKTLKYLNSVEHVMPAKKLENLNIKDEYALKWLRSMQESTAINYGDNYRRFIKWCQDNGIWESGKEIIEDAKNCGVDDLYDNHMNVIFDYIRQLGTGSNHKRLIFNIIKSFYQYYRITLPKLTRNERSILFKPNQQDYDRELALKPLELSEVKKIAMNLPQPYKSAYMLMFQSGMGTAEFDQFNQGGGWRKLLQEIDNDKPTMIRLIREKTSREEVKPYFTFVAKDAKDSIKEYLDMRPKEGDDLNCLFVSFNKPEKKYVPLRGVLLSNYVRKISKRLGLLKGQEHLKYYHTHLHELRDLFKSLCSLNGVNRIASEFFLGHDIDRLGYDKSPLYDVDFFKEQYLKLSPILNLFSENGNTSKKIDEFQEQLSKKDEEFNQLKKQMEKIEAVLGDVEKRKRFEKLLELVESGEADKILEEEK